MQDEPFDSFPVWDQASLMKRLMGKAALKEKLIKLYLQDYPNREAQLAAALAEGELESIAHTSHALKGMSGNISGMRLYALTARIEAAARVEDSAKIGELAPFLSEFGQQLTQQLEADLDGQAVPETSSDSATAGASPTGTRVSATSFRDTLSQLQGRLERGEFIDPHGIPLLTLCSQQGVTLVTDAGETLLEANLIQQTNELCDLIERFDFQPALSVVVSMMQLVSGESG